MLLGFPTCRNANDTTSRLPTCGSLIAPKLRYGLQALVPTGDAGMDPPFDADALHLGDAYFGTVENVTPEFALVATTIESSATYSVYVGGVLTSRNTDLASGDPSGVIPLLVDDTSEVVIEVRNEASGSDTVRYTLYLEYQPVEPLPPVDADGDGLVEINYLEELAMLNLNLTLFGLREGTSSFEQATLIRESGYRLSADDELRVLGCPNRVCRGYELMRDLDFNDPDSYLSGQINRNWIVPDFASTTNTGWAPIGNRGNRFTAEFEGNGYAISNLQINRDNQDFQGLFGYIGRIGVLGPSRCSTQPRLDQCACRGQHLCRGNSRRPAREHRQQLCHRQSIGIC